MITPYDRSFNAKSLGNRAMTIFAGPLFNFILAILIFTALAFVQGGVPSTDNTLGNVLSDGAAAEAGLKKGDEVLSINGKETKSWTDIVQSVSENPGKTLDFKIEREGKTQDIDVKPATQKENGKDVGKIGVETPMDSSFTAKITNGYANMELDCTNIFDSRKHVYWRIFARYAKWPSRDLHKYATSRSIWLYDCTKLDGCFKY